MKPTRQQMIDRMVRDDLGMIRRNLEKHDVEFIDAVLRGEGWVPYNQLTDQQVKEEYEDRLEAIDDHEEDYDYAYGKERNQ